MKMETVVSIVVVLSEGVVVEADEADEVVSIPLCVTRRPVSCRPASCCQGTLWRTFQNFGPKNLTRRNPTKPVAAILPVPPLRILVIELMIAMKAKKARRIMSMRKEMSVSIAVVLSM